MNEALQAAYEYFTEQGYNGSVEEFVSLLNTNPEALDATYTIFTEQGYAGSMDDFSGFLGLKKKDETEIDMVSELETGTSQPRELSRNQRLNIAAQPEKDTWVERTFGKNELTDFFGDMYRAWKTGGGQAQSVDDALKVFAAGANISDDNLQQYIDAVQNMESFAPSEEMQDFSRIYQAEGKGVKGFIKGILANPTAAIQVATSSLRAMLNPASIGAGAAGAGAGAAVGTAGGIFAPITSSVGAGVGTIMGMTGALETGLSFTEFLKEELNKKGLDFSDDNIRTVLEDEEAMGNITRRTLARGGAISTISALTGGLAMGVGANVGRNVAVNLGTKAGQIASGATGLGIQAIGGGTGEAVARAIADQEMDAAEIGFEAIGEIASPTIIGTIAGMGKVPKYKVNNEEVSEQFVQDIIKNSKNYLELDAINLEIVDSPLIENELQLKKKQLLDEFTMENSLTPEQLEAATPQDIQDLVSLQNLYNKYKDKETAAGIKNAARFKKDLDNKIDAIQKRSTETLDAQKPTPDGETVGEGDTQQQPITGETPSEQTQEAQQTEEVTTETQTEESQGLEPISAGIARQLIKSGEENKPPDPLDKYKRDEDGNVFIEEGQEDDWYWLRRDSELGWVDIVIKNKEEVVSISRDGKEVDFFLKNKIEYELIGEGVITPSEQTEEVTTEVEIEESPLAEQTVQETSTQVGNFDVVIDNNKIVSITKDGKEVSTASRNKVVKELLDQGDITLDETVTNVEGTTTPSELTSKIIESSTNPKEVASELQQYREKRKTADANELKLIHDPQRFLDVKLTEEDFINYFDKADLTPNIRRYWIDKNAAPLDGTAETIVSEISNIDLTSESVETREWIEGLKEFIVENPTKNPDWLKGGKPLVEVDLEEKFTELTGLKHTPFNVQAVIDAPTQQELQERADILESKRIDEEQRQAEAQGFVEKKAPKEKPTPPKKTIKKPEVEPDSPEAINQKALKKIEKPFNRITEKSLDTNLDNFTAKVKNQLTQRGVSTEMIRNTPLYRVDQALGLDNSTVVAETFVSPIVEVHSDFNKEQRRGNREAQKAEDLITYEGGSDTKKKLGIGRDQNEVTKDLYEIRLYQLAREHASNPDSDKSPNPVRLANFTADEAVAGRVLSEEDGKILKELLKKHVKDNNINPDTMYQSLKPSQKQALKILDKLNAELEPKIIEVNKRNGFPTEVIKDYSHRVVLMSPAEQTVSLDKKTKQFLNVDAATKFTRTDELKPIDFDPILSYTRGSQETNIEYTMKAEVDRIQDLLTQLYNKYKKGNKGQENAALALNNAIKEILRITYIRSFMDNSALGVQAKREAERMGYRVLLGSVPRMGAELIGNAAMLITQSPEVIRNSYGKYGKISFDITAQGKEDYIRILENLRSGEVSKLGSLIGTADTKYADPGNFLNLSETRKAARMQGPVQQKMSLIKKYGGKQTYAVINKVSDLLMSAGDKVIARPLWISKFAEQFKANVKKYNNEDIDLSVEDFKKIANENSPYLSDKYKKARTEATRNADRTIAEFVTSGNPFNAIIKNVRRKGEDAKNAYRVMNSFMANFNLNEYATARFAIGAMFKSGEISKPHAYKLLAGVLARMSSYVILYRTFSNYFDEVFLGAPEDEEEEDVSQVVQRQLIGSIATLMFRGGLGNIPALPVNFGIEYFNKNYLEYLRDGGEYDAYDDSIVYSLIAQDDLIDKSLPEIAVPIIAGPYGPLARTLIRGSELAVRAKTRKTQDARDRAKEELEDRITFELLGQLGLIPFYKDRRRARLKIRFQDSGKKTISRSELRRLDPDLYKRLYD